MEDAKNLQNKLSNLQRGFYLLAAIACDIMKINVVSVPDKILTPEEVDLKIENFKQMIARGEIEW